MNRDRPINHGTYGGYQTHRRRNVPIADDDPCGCIEANRQYKKKFRADNPEGYEGEKQRAKAQERALWRLKQRRPEEFHELYVHELYLLRTRKNPTSTS